jgi:hypothetical protein
VRKRQRIATAERLSQPQRGDYGQQINDDAGADDERDEPEVSTERSERGREAPEAGLRRCSCSSGRR